MIVLSLGSIIDKKKKKTIKMINRFTFVINEGIIICRRNLKPFIILFLSYFSAILQPSFSAGNQCRSKIKNSFPVRFELVDSSGRHSVHIFIRP